MQKFNIRWRDIDANRHLANSAFMDYMSQARLYFIKNHGIDHQLLKKHEIGPIAFYENIYYFKEVNPDNPVYISVELKGMSKKGCFFEFVHNMYDKRGENLATCQMMGAWISLKRRKLTPLPDPFLTNFKNLKKSTDFKIITKEDTRKHGIKPQNINPNLI